MRIFRNDKAEDGAVDRFDDPFDEPSDGPGGHESVAVTGRTDRLLAGWRRIELAVGLLLVAAGFVAVGLGWYDASGTPDVRRQMQSLISGGFGGLAAVVLGAAVIQAHVQSRGTHQLADKFDGVAAALLELAGVPTAAGEEGPTWPSGQASSGGGARAPQQVLASHASYHAAGCDLTDGRDSLRELSLDEAEAEGLARCSVCLPAPTLAAR